MKLTLAFELDLPDDHFMNVISLISAAKQALHKQASILCLPAWGAENFALKLQTKPLSPETYEIVHERETKAFKEQSDIRTINNQIVNALTIIEGAYGRMAMEDVRRHYG